MLQCSSNCFDTTGSLWFYSKDEATNFTADIEDNNNFKSFKNKATLSENTEAYEDNGILNNATIAMSLKYLSNVWRPPEMSLINCTVELNFTWKSFALCLEILIMIMMLVLMILFLLSKKQNFMSL